MSEIIAGTDNSGKPTLAESICSELGPKFVPNVVLHLKWPQPVSRSSVHEDADLLMYIFASMNDPRRRWELVEMPYVLAHERSKKISGCRIWTNYDEALIDKSRIEKLPLLWDCLLGGAAETTIGREVAFAELVKAGEEPDGKLLWTIENRMAEDEESDDDDE